MLYVFIFVAVIAIGLCAKDKKKSPNGLLSLVMAILCLPLAVLFELTKKYK